MGMVEDARHPANDGSVRVRQPITRLTGFKCRVFVPAQGIEFVGYQCRDIVQIVLVESDGKMDKGFQVLLRNDFLDLHIHGGSLSLDEFLMSIRISQKEHVLAASRPPTATIRAANTGGTPVQDGRAGVAAFLGERLSPAMMIKSFLQFLHPSSIAWAMHPLSKNFG